MTPENRAKQKAILEALAAEGLTIKEAAVRLGYTPAGVRAAAIRHSVTFAKPMTLDASFFTKAERIQRLRAILSEMASLGCSALQIAHLLKYSRASIYKFAFEFGVELVRGNDGWASHMAKSRKRGEEMFRLYEQGKTLEEVGALYGITRERVRQLMAKIGKNGAHGGQHVRAERARITAEAAKDRRYLARTGMRFAEYQAVKEQGRSERAAGKTWYMTPLGAYQLQRRNARARGIAFELSFADWWKVWQDSGKWDQRGRTKDSYVMGRYGDSGPYALGNVYICTLSENSALGQVTKKLRHIEAVKVAA